MLVPKYVLDILERSKYNYDFCTKSENYAAGYTLIIQKATTQTTIKTFLKEVQRFLNWVQRVYKTHYGGNEKIAYLLSIPTKTHYRKQYAVVTVFDPVMKDIEKYINKGDA